MQAQQVGLHASILRYLHPVNQWSRLLLVNQWSRLLLVKQWSRLLHYLCTLGHMSHSEPWGKLQRRWWKGNSGRNPFTEDQRLCLCLVDFWLSWGSTHFKSECTKLLMICQSLNGVCHVVWHLTTVNWASACIALLFYITLSLPIR